MLPLSTGGVLVVAASIMFKSYEIHRINRQIVEATTGRGVHKYSFFKYTLNIFLFIIFIIFKKFIIYFLFFLK